MWYVYCRHIKTGKEDFIKAYNTEMDAVHKIAVNYKIDYELCQQGEYYYFMKKR